MRVLKDRILIKRCTSAHKDNKNVIITLDEKPLNVFEVMDVGPDALGVFLGDTIIPEPYAIQALEQEKYKDLYVIKDSQILVVL